MLYMMINIKHIIYSIHKYTSFYHFLHNLQFISAFYHLPSNHLCLYQSYTNKNILGYRRYGHMTFIKWANI